MANNIHGNSADVDIARVIDIPVKGSDAVVTIDCSELPQDPRDLCDLLSGEDADPKYWIRLAVEYRHTQQIDPAIAILRHGLSSGSIQRYGVQKCNFHPLLASLYLEKARHAPTGVGKHIDNSSQETKDFWFDKAYQSLESGSTSINTDIPSSINRGVLAIMKFDKSNSQEEANKHFEFILKGEPNNLFAMLGKARVLFSRRNYKAALVYYQKVLRARPSMVPDPRIGIGLCFWQLDMKTEALAAWERATELDENNMAAVLLTGIFWINKAFEHVSEEQHFQDSYARGIKLVSTAYRASNSPLAGIVLASYMFSSKRMDALHKILEKVLLTVDMPVLRAEAFLGIARGQHFVEVYDQANSFYLLAKQTEPDSIVATMALGQLQLVREDLTDAKLTFENVLEKNPRCIEALTILGSIYAQEALDLNFKGDKVTHRIKAKACLDKAIHLIDESKQRSHVDATLHFTKAMLAEEDLPSQALKTLEQAADIQAENGHPVCPEILNNMAVVHHKQGNYDVAREVYQKALEECISLAKDEQTGEADTLIATITYNLGRCEEQAMNLSQAREIYSGLANRYPEYVEATARLAYMDAVEGETEKAQKSLEFLMDLDHSNVEVRALYGWLINTQKRTKGIHFNEDPERKHFNHTLKHVDNYERYSLVALGNFYLRIARETRAENDAGKSERHKHYDMAIKFFERALHYDPKNAYAAQGLAIAFAEHKHYQKAINIFSKVRESLRDESIFLNMGHCLCELHQYSRAIENYETALKLYHGGADTNLFLCLGRAWLSRGREERNAENLREALRYTQLAKAREPGNISIAFNVAFVQFQFAEILRNTPELKRSVNDLEEAAAGLNEAVQTLSAMAESKQAPYPKADIQQRATMGRNTTSKQLERAIQQQKEFESKNTAKVAEAKAKRDEEQKLREAILAETAKAEEVKQELLISKRKEMQEEARKWTERRRVEEDERAAREAERAASKKEKKVKSRQNREDSATDDEMDIAETEQRKPRSKNTKKKRTLRGPKKKVSHSEDEGDSAISASENEDGLEGTTKPLKKRKLSKKYISSELVDSEDDEEDVAMRANSPAEGQEYANEAMLDENDEGKGPETGDVQAGGQAGDVPLENSHAPVTNQPDASNFLGEREIGDSLRDGESLGLGQDGLEPTTA